MSDTSNFGFAKLVPGFDFLQNLAKGSSGALPQMPSLGSWVAPTLNVEELDKRIAELKAVHFWLEQNGKVLAATIQALELQKMTLATLRGMNFNVGDIAEAMKLKPTPAAPAAAAPKEKPAEPAKKKAESSGNGKAGAAPVDPLQWWGALTQQFQEIAANAMKDVAQRTAETARAGAAAKAAKAAGGGAKAAPAAKKSARKAPARKPRTKTTG